jgi:hypothetical protein
MYFETTYKLICTLNILTTIKDVILTMFNTVTPTLKISRIFKRVLKMILDTLIIQ